MAWQGLVAAWGALVALSVATTVLSLIDAAGPARALSAAAVIVLAGLKARVILARYLGLAQSRFWTRGFDGVLGVFLALAFGIYLVGNGG